MGHLIVRSQLLSKVLMNLNEMIDVDLPSLETILLGKSALNGTNNESCTLVMRGMNDMIRHD